MILCVILTAFVLAAALYLAAGDGAFANSAGMEMLPISPGAFTMGETHSTPPALGGDKLFPAGDWDERPAHKVAITYPFCMSRTQVTAEQFRRFRRDYPANTRYAVNVSWYEAMEFCRWLSAKEGKPYRLPTEAEWEYACRAGTDSLFSGGGLPPAPGEPNNWGLVGMHSLPAEWVCDWHDIYPAGELTDPVGPDWGFCKVVRGGGIQEETPYYARSANRGGLAPNFPPPLPPGPQFAARRAGRAVQPRWNIASPVRAGDGLVGQWHDRVTIGVDKKGETVVKARPDATRRDELAALQADWTARRRPQWSARWSGYIVGPPGDGEVEFAVRTEGLFVLRIDAAEVLRTESGGGRTRGKAHLDAGRPHWIVVEFTVPEGAAGGFELLWRRAGQECTPVPAEAIFHSDRDLEDLAGATEPEGHFVGFRVVQAEMPATRPYAHNTPFVQKCLRGNAGAVTAGPDARKPYFRVRGMLPVPPENYPPEAAGAVGFHPAILGHNHSPGLAVCPNGDVLAIHFTACSSSTEYLPNIAFIATRLRYGADRWDMPDLLLDFPDVTEESPLLWNDGGVLRLFTGGVGLNLTPFKWCSSSDNGGTWDEIAYPVFAGEIGSHSAQPITNAFRDAEGTIYLASDAAGGDSVLWASNDDGATWLDTVGRSAGRHTAYVLLKDGSILGLGGKKTDIDGYMPQAISRDGGKTWQVSKTPFPALAANQRPTVVRLASGRIFFASDFQSKVNAQPAGYPHRGAFVALSDDEGTTWRIKPLAAAQPHEGNVLPHRPGWGKAAHDDATLGYTIAAQAPNGVIHLISTMNHPCLHFEMNEAWILDDAAGVPANVPVEVPQAETIEEKHANGRTRCTYSGGVATDGRWLLDGAETWYYDDGRKQYAATWRAGRKVGAETYWNADGKVVWSWEHRDDGVSVWTQYWPTGERKAESAWRDGKCEGAAALWDAEGNVISRRQFASGVLAD